MNVQLVIQAGRVAYAAIKDENTRKWIIIILLAPILLLFLFFAAIVYIITTPLEALKMALGGDYNFESFKSLPEVIQYSAVGNYDELDFSRLTVSQSGKEIVYYNQLDSPWKNMLYGTSATIGHSGCGPTSMAIILSTLLEKEITPAEMADWSYANGYLVGSPRNGGYDYSTSHSFIPASAREYGLKCTGIDKGDSTARKVTDALLAGKFIVAIMGPGHFTTGGHFIVLSGVDTNGKIQVTDCASRTRTSQTWDLSLIINESKGYAGAGGPFWIIE